MVVPVQSSSEEINENRCCWQLRHRTNDAVTAVSRHGRDYRRGVFLSEHGGKGSNQAVAAARLGAEVSLLTSIGNDLYGEAALKLWAREGVACDHVLVAEAPTMVGIIEVEPSGENRIAIAPGALGCLGVEAVRSFREQISAAEVVVVSMEIPYEAVVTALQIGRASRTITLLNPAPARELSEDVWSLIDVITPNQSEASTLLSAVSDPASEHGARATVAELQKRTGGVAILTRGNRGALLADESGTRPILPNHMTRAVDTTGAGDSFTGALAVAIAAGIEIDAAAQFAARAAEYSVARAGVVPSLPRRGDLPQSWWPEDKGK